MFTASIGLKGIFDFKSPYKELINNEQEFKVIAIRSIQELTSNGIDVYASIYRPAKLTPDDFNNDIKNNTSLITLASDGNEQVTIPESYIAGYPDASYIKYQGKAISIDLNYLPLDYSLESVLVDLKETIYTRMGIDTKPEIVVTTPITYKTEAVDKAIQLLMKNKPSVDRSWITRYYELSTSLNNLKNENVLLKTKIATDKEKYDKLVNDYLDLKKKYDDCCKGD